MLNRISSKELTEWQAFERAHGPIAGEWNDELLASLHEQLQLLNHLFSQANFTDKHHRKGPVGKPEHYPRPDEAFGGKRQNQEPEEQTELDDEEGWLLPPSFGDNRDEEGD